MDNYIYQDGELMHHGILGMKWGVRRYQNKNGTLTNAGKKRYDREMEKAKKEARVLRNKQATANKLKKLEELQAKNKAKKNSLNGKDSGNDASPSGLKKTSNGPRKKTLSEMSNDEIRAKIERIELENRLKSLTPQKVSMGQKFVDSMLGATKDAARNILTETGKAAVNKWLGLDDSDFKKLESNAKIAEFKKKIADSEITQRKNRKEKEQDAAEAATASSKAKKEADDAGREKYGAWDGQHDNFNRGAAKNDYRSSPKYDYTVEGEGTSKYRPKSGPVYDVPSYLVSDETVSLGQRRVAGFLEDKRKKKK